MQTVQKTLQASVTKTDSFVGAEVDVNVRSGTAYLNVTAHAGTTPTLNVAIQEKDETSGAWITLASFVEVTETDGITKLDLPAIDASKLRANATIAGSSESYTYSVGFSGKEGDEN